MHIDVKNMLRDVLHAEKLQEEVVKQRTQRHGRIPEVNMHSSDKMKNEQ